MKKLKVDLDCKYAEKDSRGRLHYHGIIVVPKNLFRKRLMMPGLHLKMDELYDRKGWMKYITKDQQLDTQISKMRSLFKNSPKRESEESSEDTMLSIPQDDYVKPLKKLFK